MRTQKTSLIIGLAFFLNGCANLAPTYEKPDVSLADTWVSESLKQTGNIDITTRDLGWRDYFLDPRLQMLIETALTHNHDLRKAALNVELAEQQYGITRAAKLPAVGLSAGATRKRASTSGYIGEQYSVGLGISNYELDFWGRVRNQSEAALNQYLQTQEARDAAQLSIVNAVAKAYYQWRVATALRELSQKTLQSRQKSLQLVELRMQEGLSSGTDVTTAQSLIASARSSYQQQERAVKQVENAISTLIGQPVNALTLPDGLSLAKQFPNGELYANTPSTVLLKRPDIRQAEYGLKAANANIGVARAAMYPTITLTGNLGMASASLSNLFDGVSRTWSYGPSINLPIFDGGRRKANIKITELQKKMAIESYQGAVQAAFQDVSNALIARETFDKQYLAELDGLKATAKTLRLVKLQMQEGLVNALNLLDAERADFRTRQGVLATQLQVLNNRVDLYTAMGGGLNEKSKMEQ